MSQEPLNKPDHPVSFFGISAPAGKPFHTPEATDWATLDKQRPDIIRRIECHTCPKLVTYMYPVDAEGNILPKHACKILDVDNANIEIENSKRHPTEQLLYGNCIFGEIPIPTFPRNASDYQGQR